MREMEGGGWEGGWEEGTYILLVGGREGGSNDEGEGVRVGVHELLFFLCVCAGASKRAHSSSPQKVCQTRQL